MEVLASHPDGKVQNKNYERFFVKIRENSLKAKISGREKILDCFRTRSPGNRNLHRRQMVDKTGFVSYR